MRLYNNEHILIQKIKWTCTFCITTLKPLYVKLSMLNVYTVLYISIHIRIKITNSFVIMRRNKKIKFFTCTSFQRKFSKQLFDYFL